MRPNTAGVRRRQWLAPVVQPTGTRWVQRLVIRRRRGNSGSGGGGLVPLAEARELALANRKPARSGDDRLSDKRRAEDVSTFAEAAEPVLEQKRDVWRGRWHTRMAEHGALARKPRNMLIVIGLRTSRAPVPLVVSIVAHRIPADRERRLRTDRRRAPLRSSSS